MPLDHNQFDPGWSEYQFQLTTLPLPIVHADFTFDDKALVELGKLRDGMALLQEHRTRRVVEIVEQMVVGQDTEIVFGTPRMQPVLDRLKQLKDDLVSPDLIVEE